VNIPFVKIKLIYGCFFALIGNLVKNQNSSQSTVKATKHSSAINLHENHWETGKMNGVGLKL